MQIWNSRNCVWCSSLIGQQMSHYGIRRSKCEHCLCREGMNAKILHMSLPTLRSKPEVHLLLCCAQTGLLLFPQESPCIQTTQPCWVQSPSAWHLKERRLFFYYFLAGLRKSKQCKWSILGAWAVNHLRSDHIMDEDQESITLLEASSMVFSRNSIKVARKRALSLFHRIILGLDKRDFWSCYSFFSQWLNRVIFVRWEIHYKGFSLYNGTSYKSIPRPLHGHRSEKLLSSHFVFFRVLSVFGWLLPLALSLSMSVSISRKFSFFFSSFKCYREWESSLATEITK